MSACETMGPRSACHALRKPRLADFSISIGTAFRPIRDSEIGQKVVKSLPKRRLANVEDLTQLFLLLISEKAARTVNGAAIAADDGYSVS